MNRSFFSPPVSPPVVWSTAPDYLPRFSMDVLPVAVQPRKRPVLQPAVVQPAVPCENTSNVTPFGAEVCNQSFSFAISCPVSPCLPNEKENVYPNGPSLDTSAEQQIEFSPEKNLNPAIGSKKPKLTSDQFDLERSLTFKGYVYSRNGNNAFGDVIYYRCNKYRGIAGNLATKCCATMHVKYMGKLICLLFSNCFHLSV